MPSLAPCRFSVGRNIQFQGTSALFWAPCYVPHIMNYSCATKIMIEMCPHECFLPFPRSTLGSSVDNGIIVNVCVGSTCSKHLCSFASSKKGNIRAHLLNFSFLYNHAKHKSSRGCGGGIKLWDSAFEAEWICDFYCYVVVNFISDCINQCKWDRALQPAVPLQFVGRLRHMQCAFNICSSTCPTCSSLQLALEYCCCFDNNLLIFQK